MDYFFPNFEEEENDVSPFQHIYYQHPPVNDLCFFKENKDSSFLFLSDFWPDVNHPQKTLETWKIPNRYPLFKINQVGSFRSIKHLYYYSFFKYIQDNKYAELFLWEQRHIAASVLQNFLCEGKDKAVDLEEKKTTPSQNKVLKIISNWANIKTHGLRSNETIKLGSWECYSSPFNPYQHTNDIQQKKVFKQQIESFERKEIIRVYAFGIYLMYLQNPILKKSLVQGTEHQLLKSQGRRKILDCTPANTGYNLLGELHMHYRSCVQNENDHGETFFLQIYRGYKYQRTGTSFNFEMSKKYYNRIFYFEELMSQMKREATKKRWDNVKKCADSISYLFKQSS